MNEPLTAVEQIRRALTVPTRGVLGLVDEMLAAPWEDTLRLEWHAGQCQVRLEDGSDDLIDVPLQKSVVRAALARIAVLCNERVPNSVSPYGGNGEIGRPATDVFQVVFVNTPDEQSLELVRLPLGQKENCEADKKHKLGAIVE